MACRPWRRRPQPRPLPAPRGCRQRFRQMRRSIVDPVYGHRSKACRRHNRSGWRQARDTRASSKLAGISQWHKLASSPGVQRGRVRAGRITSRGAVLANAAPETDRHYVQMRQHRRRRPLLLPSYGVAERSYRYFSHATPFSPHSSRFTNVSHPSAMFTAAGLESALYFVGTVLARALCMCIFEQTAVLVLTDAS